MLLLLEEEIQERVLLFALNKIDSVPGKIQAQVIQCYNIILVLSLQLPSRAIAVYFVFPILVSCLNFATALHALFSLGESTRPWVSCM